MAIILGVLTGDIPLKDIIALIDEMYSMGLRFIHISGARH